VEATSASTQKNSKTIGGDGDNISMPQQIEITMGPAQRAITTTATEN